MRKLGEEDSPSITKADLPAIEKLYDSVSKALQKRPHSIQIPSIANDPEGTYRQFLTVVNKHK